jgi:1-aminocyclopropane-1-carboxylate deaminase
MTAPLHPTILALQAEIGVSPLQRIVDSELNRHGVELWMKRDDLLHPVISGNKWRKLKYPLNHALRLGADTVVSMGGQHSNYLHALAFATQKLGMKSIGIIRGEPTAAYNPTLMDLQTWGMQLRFVSRSEYRALRQEPVPESRLVLSRAEHWLPEGGASSLALPGVAEAITEIDIDYDVLAVPCGTGATMAGLIANAPARTKVLGVAVLKNAGFLVNDVQQLLDCQNPGRNNWQIALDFHCGGFACYNQGLLDFICEFSIRHQLPIEPVYSGKLLFGIFALLRNGYFSAGQRIIAFHTGGLQGLRTLQK